MKLEGKIVVLEQNRPCDDESSVDLLGVFEDKEEARMFLIEHIKKAFDLCEVQEYENGFQIQSIHGTTEWKFLMS